MAKKGKQSVPAHRFIRIDLEHDGTEDFHYIDLARELSAINNRLYRQGMTYHVANISVHDSNSSFLKFCTLPNTWPLRNSWRRAFQMWLNMNDQLDDQLLSTASKASKWTDFKVYFSDDHRSDPDDGKFTDVEGNVRRDGEWEYTRFFSTDGGSVDEFSIHMLGTHTGSPGSYTSVGALAAYNETLTYPSASPSEVSTMDTGVWNNLIETAGVNDDLSTALSDDNDNPPYDAFIFPGMKAGMTGNSHQPWSAREIHLKGTYQNSAMVGGFEVPLGLICVETGASSGENTIGLIIELAPGDYKGVSAESMGEPKKVNDKVWKVS